MSTAPSRFGSPAWLSRIRPRPRLPITILIVDDEEPVRKLVERILGDAGYITTGASSGPEALQVAANHDSFDLLVTDMMMPEMTGNELARRLRQHHPELKVLYLTGYSDRLFDEKLTMWEDEAFMEKPFTPKGLLEAVSLLWSQHLTTSCPARPEVKGEIAT